MDLERAWSIVGGVARQFLSPTISVYWGYLLAAGLIALAVYARKARRASVMGGLRFLFPRRIWLSRSAANDLGLFVVNTLIYSFLLLGPLQALSSTIAQRTWLLLFEVGGPIAPISGPAISVGMTLVIFVAADLAFFLAHAAMHRIGFLWEFHKVHHSATVLEPLAVFRRHPVDVVVEGAMTGLILGPLYGLMLWLSAGDLTLTTVLGTNLFLFAALVLGFDLQHSEVWLSFGRFDRVFISPATHQIHHSSDPAHHDRNFGNILALWDRLAGTLVPGREFAHRPALVFGLGGEEERMRSTPSLLLRPIGAALRRLLRWRG